MTVVATTEPMVPEPGKFKYNLYRIKYTGGAPDHKLNFQSAFGFYSHRSGWGEVMKSVAPIHNPEGVHVDSFVEKAFGWDTINYKNNEVNYNKPWVGFVHNPPTVPDWYMTSTRLGSIIESVSFKRCLKSCEGLYVLSDHLKDWLVTKVDVPVNTLYHPCPCSNLNYRFSFDAWENNNKKMLIDVGTWLRKQSTLRLLQPSNIRKVKLWPIGYQHGTIDRARAQRFLYKEIDSLGIDEGSLNTVPELDGVSNQVYDSLLSNNIVLVDYWDASASNTILDCIERATPIVCPRLPAVVEYLTDDYPLLFNNVNDIENMLCDQNLIYQAHIHLKNIFNTGKYSIDTFIQGLINSDIYRNLTIN